MKRVLCALLLGLVAGVFVATVAFASDSLWPLYGARRLLAGINPYALPYPEIDPDPRYTWLYYPLPALLVFVPVIWLPDRLAVAVVCGVAFGLLAYAVIPRRHAWLLLVSYPAAACLWYANPFPLICAAAWHLPALTALTLSKPNVAIPVLFSRPSRCWLPVGMSAALVAASIALGWLDHLSAHQNGIAIVTPFGAFAALAVLRFRNSRARLVLLTACMPLRSTDTIVLFWTAQHVWQSVALCVCSWLSLVLPLPLVTMAAALVLLPYASFHDSSRKAGT